MSKVKYFLILILTTFSFYGFAQTQGNLSVSVSTSSAGGNFSPKHIMAVWIEDSTGNFVKTLLAYADKRIQYLNTWEAATGAKGIMYNRTDAVTGATRTSHSTRTCSWDGTDYNKSAVPDGKYYLCMELTDKHETGNVSKFSFVKGESNLVNPANAPSFSSVSVNWQKSGTVDAPAFYVNDNPAIFPNPTRGVIKISGYRIDKIEIHSISGAMVRSSFNENQIDLSDLNNGIYLMKITYNDKLYVKKIIKE